LRAARLPAVHPRRARVRRGCPRRAAGELGRRGSRRAPAPLVPRSPPAAVGTVAGGAPPVGMRCVACRAATRNRGRRAGAARAVRQGSPACPPPRLTRASALVRSGWRAGRSSTAGLREAATLPLNRGRRGCPPHWHLLVSVV